MLPTTISTVLQKPEDVLRLNLDALRIHTRFRGHHRLSITDHQNLFRHELITAVESDGTCNVVSAGDRTVAACGIKPLTWDTQHFGLPMAKLSVAASQDCPLDTLSNLIKSTVGAVKNGKPRLHVSCEVDIDDYACLNALLSLGACILDVKREYRWTSFKGIKAPKFLSRIRDYRPEDKPQIMQLLNESHFESRFSRDPLLDPKKTIALYRIWLEKLLDGQQSDRIALVMERNGRVQACGTIEKLDLSYANVDLKIMSGGIYVSCTEATGGYYPMIYSLVDRASVLCGSSQTCVSLNNHAAIKVLEKMNLGTLSTRYALRLEI